MKHSISLKHRLRVIEEGQGAGCLTLTFDDGSKRAFNFSRSDRLKILLAAFQIARQSRNPAAKSSASPRAVEIARLIARAEQITPTSRYWAMIAGGVRKSEKESQEIAEGAAEENSDATPDVPDVQVAETQ